MKLWHVSLKGSTFMSQICSVLSWNQNLVLNTNFVKSQQKHLGAFNYLKFTIRSYIYIYFNRIHSLEKFLVHSEVEQQVQTVPRYPCPPTYTTSCTVHISYQDLIFVTTEEPTTTHYYPPRSIVYGKLHSWCFTFCDIINV